MIIQFMSPVRFDNSITSARMCLPIIIFSSYFSPYVEKICDICDLYGGSDIGHMILHVVAGHHELPSVHIKLIVRMG